MSIESAQTIEASESNLIVTDNQSVAVALQQALARLGENGPQDVIFSMEDASLAIDLHQRTTRRVFVALGEDVMRGLAAVRQIRGMCALPLFVVGPRDAGLILDAVHAGADCFIEDFDPLDEYLSRALSRPMTNDRATSEGKLICITSGRGGCGSSLISANLAIAFAQRMKRIGLCDFDFQNGVCDALLNLRPKHTILDLLGCSNGLDRNSIDSALTRHTSGVNLLSAPLKPIQSQFQIGDLCQRVVRIMKQMFPIVVADLSRFSPDAEVEPLLSACSKLILVTQLEFNSIRCTRRALDHLGRIGISPQRIQVVGNRDGQPNLLSISHAEQALGCKISHVFADDSRNINRSVNCGTPFYTTMPTSPLIKTLDQLAESLLSELGHFVVPAISKTPISADWKAIFFATFKRLRGNLANSQDESE